MTKYYLLTGNISKEVTKQEWLSIVGEEQDRPYINKLYKGNISVESIPEDRRESVQMVVNNRIAKYGTYYDRILSAKELKDLVDAFYRKQITRGEAIALFDSLNSMRNLTPNSVASMLPEAYPKLIEDGQLVKAGTRINWNGVIKRAMIDLWDTSFNNPDNAPTLWEDIDYKEGYRVIPEVITASAAFSEGEIGWWNGKLYESLLDSNVWTPDAYPTGWLLLSSEESE